MRKMLRLTIGLFGPTNICIPRDKPDSYTKQFLDYMMSDEVQEKTSSQKWVTFPSIA